MTILIVHSDAGKCAAYRLEELLRQQNKINKSNDPYSNGNDCISVVHWGEKQWEDNQYTSVSNLKLFIGNIQAVEEIRKISTSTSLRNFGITYSISGNIAIVTANPKVLLSSQYKYECFYQDLQTIAPNSIEPISHGREKIKSFMKGGIKKMLEDRKAVEEQQLLYGTVMFFKEKFFNLIKDSCI